MSRFTGAAMCLCAVIWATSLTAADLKWLNVEEARMDENGKVCWYDARKLTVEGQGWNDTESEYDRLPARANGKVPGPVWALSHDSAGICVRFVTDSQTLHARWELRSTSLAMVHMPATGKSGLDLYVKMPDGSWHWLAIGKPEGKTNEVVLVGGLPAGEREYLLYLPLYNGVTSVEVGLPEGAKIAPGPARAVGRSKPVVFYGTSITQGGCASRTGMPHPALVGRWLNVPVINLGFSGNGRMEPIMAELLAELEPSVYVLDCLPNMQAKEVAERVEPFVRILRKSHPTTPIVLVEDRTYSNAFLVPGTRKRNETSRAALRTAYQNLLKQGLTGLHYLDGEKLLGPDGEGTVDGSHPTDLGFWRQAEAFRAVLDPLLPADD